MAHRNPKKKLPPDSELVAKIDAFLKDRPDFSVTRFGLAVLNDRRLVPDLRKGRDIRRSTRATILSFIESQTRNTPSPPG